MKKLSDTQKLVIGFFVTVALIALVVIVHLLTDKHVVLNV
jgi:hypothetical protein